MHFRRVPTVQPQHLHAVLQQIIVEPSKVREAEWEVVAVVEACQELGSDARLSGATFRYVKEMGKRIQARVAILSAYLSRSLRGCRSARRFNKEVVNGLLECFG
ncbi:hypothetical protein BSFA1_87910 (plasmid) [Burkholderia sp. SFA1]|nr:hypothetical protein BSFA1_87910 [Burkholderia sp. SFA1]